MKSLTTILFLFCSLLSIGQTCSVNQGGAALQVIGIDIAKTFFQKRTFNCVK